jgi:dienelactone hydrolase
MQATTSFKSGGKSIAADLFQPPGVPNGGVVVIAYGSDGLVDTAHGAWASMIRQYGRDLAHKGFTALIPDYFQRTNTRAGDVNFQQRGAEQIWMHRDEWQSTLADAAARAQTLPGVDRSRIGLLGFSLGGHLCLRIRTDAKVLVEFFAPVLDGLGPGRHAVIHAQIHHGDADSLAPFADNAQRIDRELREGGAATELCGYDGATHGFSGSDPANTKARALSKARTVAFFEAHL